VLLGAAALTLSAVLAPPIRALTFSSSCDRFAIDGNAFGPADGTLDFVDDFGSGTLAPNWEVLLGSAAESGGQLLVHSPGSDVQLGPTLFEISTVENALHGIEQGAGNFVMTSDWSPPLPALNAELHMQLYSISPIIEAAGITLTNLSPEVATQQGNGSIAGYSVSQSVTQGVGAGFTTVQFGSVPINPASVTGAIVLRMSFDDATDTLTCSFSVDGGATFQSPFAPMHIFNGGVTDYDVLLGAAALAPNGVPPPPTQTSPLDLLVVKTRATPESRRVTYKASFLRGQGIFVGNPTSGGATLNLKVDAVSQCFRMPASGWSRSGPGYKYVDRAGSHGPVKVAGFRQKANGGVQIKVALDGSRGPIDIVPPNPGIQGDANFHVAGSGEYCASTVGGTIHPNDARTFKVKKAPAPPGCYVTACSPSGAFLDLED
jgi:hypothetical protein